MADIYFVRDSLAVFGGSGRQAKPRPAGNIGQNFGRLGEDESKQERNLPRQGRTTGIPRISTGLQNFGRVIHIGGATSLLDFEIAFDM